MKLLPIAGARILATTCLLLLCVASAHGADKNPAAKLWKKMARSDLGAAYELLSENHPAAVPALGDEDFRRRLESGYKTALSYAARADTYPGYRAALLYFANAFSDRHIWSRDLYTPRRLDWPGFLAVRRGGWRVFARDEADAEAPQLGAEIVSCDGQALDELAKASSHDAMRVPVDTVTKVIDGDTIDMQLSRVPDPSPAPRGRHGKASMQGSLRRFCAFPRSRFP